MKAVDLVILITSYEAFHVALCYFVHVVKILFYYKNVAVALVLLFHPEYLNKNK